MRHWDAEAGSRIIGTLAQLEGALLPNLHALQERFGCVPEEAVPVVAAALNLSRAEVHGVVSFYHDFRQRPPGTRVLRLCRAESCQALGSEALAHHLAETHGLGMGETTPDGRLTVEAVYCLGNCGLSPAAMLDGEPLGRVDLAMLDRIVREATGPHA
jgi:formate dehydrogenase subunit gamma